MKPQALDTRPRARVIYSNPKIAKDYAHHHRRPSRWALVRAVVMDAVVLVAVACIALSMTARCTAPEPVAAQLERAPQSAMQDGERAL